MGTGLAMLRNKVLLIDTDIGLRNLDVVMGLENRVVYNLVDVIEGNCRYKQALIKDRYIPDLFLLPCAQTKDKTSIMPEQLVKFVDNLRNEFDYIILDPPAFTKSSATVKNAVRGYKEINLKAMRLLKRGGYLATCSCSHFMTEPLFKRMLHDAAKDAEVSLRQIEARRQSPDHPILWNVPETDYLKFYIFQVV